MNEIFPQFTEAFYKNNANEAALATADNTQLYTPKQQHVSCLHQTSHSKIPYLP